MKKPTSRNHQLAEVFGWYGMLAIICAYGLASFGIIEAQGGLYQLLNLTGSLSLIAISIVKKIAQTVILNLFWATIGIVSLVRIIFS